MNDTTRSRKREEGANTRNGRTPDRVKIKITGNWTAIPNRLLADRQLSRDARLLGALIFMHAANGSRAFPSQQLLAEELSAPVTVTETDKETGEKRSHEVERPVAIRSVQRWLTELQNAGWLEWRQTMRYNEYTLLDPREFNENQIRATVESPNDVEEHDSDATVQSCGATVQSPHTTVQSPSMIVQSPHMTVQSRSTLYDSDSLYSDSSSPDSLPIHKSDDDDGGAFTQNKKDSTQPDSRNLPPTSAPPPSTPLYAWLRSEIGVSEKRAAINAHHDEGAARAEMFDAIGDTIGEERERRIGRVLKRWEVRPPRPATAERENGPINITRFTTGEYADLFRRGGDVDQEDLDEREVGVG